jgi:hypothetical protein
MQISLSASWTPHYDRIGDEIVGNVHTFNDFWGCQLGFFLLENVSHLAVFTLIEMPINDRRFNIRTLPLAHSGPLTASVTMQISIKPLATTR